MCKFIEKIEQQEKAGGLNEEMEALLNRTFGPTLGAKVNLQQIIEQIKAHDLRIIALMRNLTY